MSITTKTISSGLFHSLDDWVFPSWLNAVSGADCRSTVVFLFAICSSFCSLDIFRVVSLTPMYYQCSILGYFMSLNRMDPFLL